MYGELIPLGGGDPIPLLHKKLLIGRRPSCDITLDFSNVSGNHCVMQFENGYWKVRDLGSSNGTRLNSDRVYEDEWIMPGDTLIIARKHKYTVQYTPEGIEPPESQADSQEEMSLLDKAGLTNRGRRNNSARTGSNPSVSAADIDDDNWEKLFE